MRVLVLDVSTSAQRCHIAKGNPQIKRIAQINAAGRAAVLGDSVVIEVERYRRGKTAHQFNGHVTIVLVLSNAVLVLALDVSTSEQR